MCLWCFSFFFFEMVVMIFLCQLNCWLFVQILYCAPIDQGWTILNVIPPLFKLAKHKESIIIYQARTFKNKDLSFQHWTEPNTAEKQILSLAKSFMFSWHSKSYAFVFKQNTKPPQPDQLTLRSEGCVHYQKNFATTTKIKKVFVTNERHVMRTDSQFTHWSVRFEQDQLSSLC